MKKLIGSIAICLFPLWSFAQKEISLPSAPAQLSGVNDSWTKEAEGILKAFEIEGIDADPNYGFSEMAMYMGGSEQGKVLLSVLKNPEMTALLYNWLEPALAISFENLPQWQKIRVLDALRHCKKYCENFNLAQEDAYLAELQKRSLVGFYVMGGSHPYTQDYEGLFVRYAPSDYYDKNYDKPFPWEFKSNYRRLEAFIYRRVKEGAKIDIFKTYIDKMLGFMKVQDGAFSNNYPDGQLREKGNIKNGLPEGEWEYYAIQQYSDDKKAKLSQKGTFVNGLREGKWVFPSSWDDTGIDRQEMRYEKGVPKEYWYYSSSLDNSQPWHYVNFDKRQRIVYDIMTKQLQKDFNFDKDYDYTYPSFNIANEHVELVKIMDLSMGEFDPAEGFPNGFNTYPNLHTIIFDNYCVRMSDLLSAVSGAKALKLVSLRGCDYTKDEKKKLTKKLKGAKIIWE